MAHNAVKYIHKYKHITKKQTKTKHPVKHKLIIPSHTHILYSVPIDYSPFLIANGFHHVTGGASLGSISPSTFLGHTIQVFATSYNDTHLDTSFMLRAVVPQNIFTSIRIGASIIYSADAVFYHEDGALEDEGLVSVWSWNGLGGIRLIPNSGTLYVTIE